MEEVNTPLGLDFDHTQMLVLVTSELFRLSHDLMFRHKGLEDALAARNKQESKRKRYDRLKVPQWQLRFPHYALRFCLPHAVAWPWP